MLKGLYSVEKVLMRRKNIKTKQVEYKIKWQGYPYSQCTWEPFKNLKSVEDMVDQFNRQNPLNPSIHKNHPIAKKRVKQTSNVKQSQIIKKRYKIPNEKQKNLNKSNGMLKQSVQSEIQSEEQKQEVEELMSNNLSSSVCESIKNSFNSQDELQKVNQMRRQRQSISDNFGELKVISVQQNAKKELFFQVSFPQQTKLLSHQMMKSHHPIELIIFYEKYLTLTSEGSE